MRHRLDDLADLCQVFSVAGVGLRNSISTASACHQQGCAHQRRCARMTMTESDEC